MATAVAPAGPDTSNISDFCDALSNAQFQIGSDGYLIPNEDLVKRLGLLIPQHHTPYYPADACPAATAAPSVAKCGKCPSTPGTYMLPRSRIYKPTQSPSANDGSSSLPITGPPMNVVASAPGADGGAKPVLAASSTAERGTSTLGVGWIMVASIKLGYSGIKSIVADSAPQPSKVADQVSFINRFLDSTHPIPQQLGWGMPTEGNQYFGDGKVWMRENGGIFMNITCSDKF
ncbi:hypothetical protein HDU96_009518 [Phlyctochytrium bullatum]|nr:hypothetical protein HDU96_009518 [Phlyctochytrium bullatum]